MIRLLVSAGSAVDAVATVIAVAGIDAGRLIRARADT
jgi:hypothetical protein